MIIACIISFIVGALIMICFLGLVSTCKDNTPRNKVHFYVSCEYINLVGLTYTLWIGNCKCKSMRMALNGSNKLFSISSEDFFHRYNLRKTDFADMKDGELREVLINMED